MQQRVTVERPAGGRPHAGKALAIVAPHSDDVSLFAGGTIAKLIDEGYTAYLIRVTNDEKDSYDLSMGETVLGNERDTQEIARILGIKSIFHLNYRNHRMDDIPPTELRDRLIFIFRTIQADTMMGFDGWARGEGNPDHYVTGMVSEAASWWAGTHLDLPEQYAAGLKPHTVMEKYQWWTWWADDAGLVNRVVDISPFIERKVEAMCANRTQLKNTVRSLQDKLAEQKLRLRILETDDATAIRNYVNAMYVEPAAELGRAYGVKYAEQFRYSNINPWINEWILKHAEPLESPPAGAPERSTRRSR